MAIITLNLLDTIGAFSLAVILAQDTPLFVVHINVFIERKVGEV